jgi:DNA repair exonuclease SbcCD ATPase subunit
MILFTKVRYRNFLSSGNSFTEIDLNRSPNTLIIGKNGAGKTTVLSAITFCLFNNPYRNVNLPQVVNSINQKDCVVEVEFKIGKSLFLVRRGMKPNLFEIHQNGKMIDQDAGKKDYQDTLEKTILKMNYKSFTQIVVLGSSAFVPFMRLRASDRRVVIEEILDIQIYSAMNVIVKQKLLIIKETLERNRRDIELTEEKIKFVRKHVSEVKSSNKNKITENKGKIKNHKNALKDNVKKIETLQKTIIKLEKSVQDKEQIESKRWQLENYKTKIETNKTRIETELRFYEENDNCPTCHQDIEHHLKECKTKELQDKLDKINDGLIQLIDQINLVKERKSKISETINSVNDIKIEITHINAENKSIESYVNNLEILNSELSSNPTVVGNEDYEKKLQLLKNELNQLHLEKEKLIVDREYLEMESNLLKDSGIKTRIIKKYLPKINMLVNKYLSSMDFFVNFNLDENFTETIKSRHRDDFSYESFSEGEKQKIDLSLLFTWRAIARLKNSVATNLLILDEVFDSSLDSAGTEDLLKILQSFGTDTNIFVISHRQDILFDKFHSIIKFEKRNNFSVLVPAT